MEATRADGRRHAVLGTAPRVGCAISRPLTRGSDDGDRDPASRATGPCAARSPRSHARRHRPQPRAAASCRRRLGGPRHHHSQRRRTPRSRRSPVAPSPTGATAVVTRACDHTSRTGPCSIALIDAACPRRARAVDPNPVGKAPAWHPFASGGRWALARERRSARSGPSPSRCATVRHVEGREPSRRPGGGRRRDEPLDPRPVDPRGGAHCGPRSTPSSARHGAGTTRTWRRVDGVVLPVQPLRVIVGRATPEGSARRRRPPCIREHDPRGARRSARPGVQHVRSRRSALRPRSSARASWIRWYTAPALLGDARADGGHQLTDALRLRMDVARVGDDVASTPGSGERGLVFTGIVEELGSVVRSSRSPTLRLWPGPLVTSDAVRGVDRRQRRLLTVVEMGDGSSPPTSCRDPGALLARALEAGRRQPRRPSPRHGSAATSCRGTSTAPAIEREPGEHWELVRISLPGDLGVRRGEGLHHRRRHPLTVVEAQATGSRRSSDHARADDARAKVGTPSTSGVDVVAKYVERMLQWRTSDHRHRHHRGPPRLGRGRSAAIREGAPSSSSTTRTARTGRPHLHRAEATPSSRLHDPLDLRLHLRGDAGRDLDRSACRR